MKLTRPATDYRNYPESPPAEHGTNTAAENIGHDASDNPAPSPETNSQAQRPARTGVTRLDVAALDRLDEIPWPTKRGAQQSARPLLSTFATPLAGIYNTTTGVARKMLGKTGPHFDNLADQNVHQIDERATEIRALLKHVTEQRNKLPGTPIPKPSVSSADAGNRCGAVMAHMSALVEHAAKPTLKNMLNSIDEGLPGLATNLSEIDAQLRLEQDLNTNTQRLKTSIQELNAIVGQEQQRKILGQRMMAIMVTRYSYCDALQFAITQAQQASVAPINEHSQSARSSPQTTTYPSPKQTPSPPSSDDEPSTSGATISALAKTRIALYNFIATLLEAFNIRLELMYFDSPKIRKEKANAKTEEEVKTEFRETYKNMLRKLGNDHAENSTVSASAVRAALKNLQAGGAAPTPKTAYELRCDIKIGEKITHAILTSPPNFGAIVYTHKSGERVSNYAVPSSLTTVRAIAQYLEAQALSTPYPPATPPIISRDRSGAYTIADPSRRLYNFLAAASTAYPNFLHSTELAATCLQDANMSRMTIIDHRDTFPGGANKMEFDSQLDQRGNSILTVRFSKQDKTSLFKPTHAMLIACIEDVKKTKLRFASTQNGVIFLQQFTKKLDALKHSKAEISDYIENLTISLHEQTKLLQADCHQYAALNQWKNPVFS